MINWSSLCAQNGVWYSRGTAFSRCPRHERGLGEFDNLFPIAERARTDFSKKIQLFIMNYSLFIKKVCICAIFVVPLHRICKRMQLKQQY